MNPNALIAQRPRPVDCLQLAIGDFPVSVSSAMPNLLEDLKKLYSLHRDDARNEKPTIRMEVRKTRAPLGRARYAIYGDDQEITQGRIPREVVPYLEWGINLRLMATHPEYVQLHAASMSRDGQGFIFAGESGCGKSTLAACLLARGWHYLCDEFALIDRATLLLHPFPKALCIKGGSFAVVRREGLRFTRRGDYIKSRKGRVAYINPHDVRSGAIGRPCAVRAIVFPKYSGKDDPRCVPLSRSRAMLELVGCVFNRDAFLDGGLSVIHELLQNANCYRLEVGTPEKTCKLIDSLVGREITFAPAHHPATTVSAKPSTRRIEAPTLSRRDMFHRGVKLAFTVPTVATLLSRPAYAAASNPSGACSTGVQTGGLCESDADCCSGDCDFGICN